MIPKLNRTCQMISCMYYFMYYLDAIYVLLMYVPTYHCVMFIFLKITLAFIIYYTVCSRSNTLDRRFALENIRKKTEEKV